MKAGWVIILIPLALLRAPRALVVRRLCVRPCVRPCARPSQRTRPVWQALTEKWTDDCFPCTVYDRVPLLLRAGVQAAAPTLHVRTKRVD